MIPLLLAAAVIGGFIWWDSRQQRFGRDITLRQNQWYYIIVRDSSGTGEDYAANMALMIQSLGFCEVSQWSWNEGLAVQPGPAGTATGFTIEVQLTARWCNPDTAWTVPENVAITKAS